MNEISKLEVRFIVAPKKVNKILFRKMREFANLQGSSIWYFKSLRMLYQLLDNTTLAYYEVGAETEVIVDGSPVRLGAMLTQKKDGYRPVTYISRSPLSPVEQRYSQTEREALAIRWACERLRMYLAGARFKVVTDHKPLEAIFNSSNSKAPVIIERWSM